MAGRIAEELGIAAADVHDVAGAAADAVQRYDCLLLGSSTWGCGELQDDWFGFLEGLKGQDLSGKSVALFGCGDSSMYPDTFCDAVGILREELAGTGCRFVGAYAPQNYSVTDSKVCEDGKFVGLAIDEADSEAVSSEHLKQWIAVLKGRGMSEQDYVRFGELKIFMHQIYEFKKGVRNLVLCTMCPTCAALVAERLRGQRIEYLIQEVTDNKVNLYFGKRACLDAVRAFIDKPLNRLTPEQDFMLGAMLGYDIIQQCERFCRQRSRFAL